MLHSAWELIYWVKKNLKRVGVKLQIDRILYCRWCYAIITIDQPRPTLCSAALHIQQEFRAFLFKALRASLQRNEFFSLPAGQSLHASVKQNRAASWDWYIYNMATCVMCLMSRTLYFMCNSSFTLKYWFGRLIQDGKYINLYKFCWK